MRVLLFDTSAYYPSSPLFLEALDKLAADQPEEVEYTFVDQAPFERPEGAIGKRILRRVLRRSAVDGSELNRVLLQRARSFHPDLVLVCKGAFIFPATLAEIKRETSAFIANYATDDPFNPRVSTRELVEAIPFYDLYACTKREIISDITRAGCANAIYVPFGYKPSLHYPEPPATSEDRHRFVSDVVFIGGCDRDRTPFFTELLRRIPGLNLKLYGGFWNRHPSLRRYWHGLAMGRDYRMALGGTKIAVNLVRRANRDGHVMRSFEIPACGAFMLAERTPEHLELFGRSSVAYFASADELVDQVGYYLAHEQEREAIAQNGHAKVTSETNTYLDRLLALVGAVQLLDSSRRDVKAILR